MNRLRAVMCRCVAAAMVAAGFAAFAAGAEQEKGLTEEYLKKHYFKSMRVQQGNLMLQLQDRGGNYIYRRTSQQSESAAPGETLAVQPGNSLAFISRHVGLRFSPLPSPLEKKGFFVRHTHDERSFGREVTRKDAIILLFPSGGLRLVDVPQGLEPAGPLPADLLARLNQLLSQADPLPVHGLSAETAIGKASPPFPSSLSKLVFDWKLAPSAPGAAIEIRWIAADTGDAAPKDTVITTGKSDVGKTEGTFTLTRPTNGFPAGSYRVEIWQAGRMIHSETFTVQK